MPNETIDAYPLAWPAGWPRTQPPFRVRAKFSNQERVYHPPSTPGGASHSYLRKRELTVADGVRRVRIEIDRLGARTLIISTNVELRNDGLPRSGRRAPDDPGVAVYWTSADGEAQCMAIDLYDTVAGNLAAVAASIEALRAIERHGGAQILKRAFQGFRALPATTTDTLTAAAAARVLIEKASVGYSTTELLAARDVARIAYRAAAAATHPDRGGSTEDFQRVQLARRALEQHFGASLG